MGATERVLDALGGAEFGSMQVVLLPDFYLDHLIRFPDLRDALAGFERGLSEGNVDVCPESQMLRPGGNAGNAAFALARLGVRAHLIARTDPVGMAFLDRTLAEAGVDVGRVRADGDVAVTAALEAPNGSVMVSGPRNCPTLAPEDLAEEDWRLIETSDGVLVANWANDAANPLAGEVLRAAKRGGAHTMVDTGDPAGHPEGVRRGLWQVLTSPDLDAVGVNAFELLHFVDAEPTGPDCLEAAGRELSTRIPARVELHSTQLIASFHRGRVEARTRAFPVRPRQATGAGDTWNAGALLGHLLGLDVEARLVLATALASLYVRSEDGLPPTAAAVQAFLAQVVSEGPAPRGNPGSAGR